MRLTETAKRLIDPLEATLASVMNFLDDKPFAAATAQRRFRIATADYVSAVLLPRLLDILAREAPHISVQIVTARKRSDEDLLADRLDLIIAPSQLMGTTLFEARNFKLEMKPLRPDIPIYVASLQEQAIREVGRSADGWLPTFWPYEHLRDGIALLREGAIQAGRDPGKIETAPFVAVIPLEDRAMARSMIKPGVSFYIGGMGTYYHALFCRYGFADNANLVKGLYDAGKRKEAAAAVSDDLVDKIAICGPPEFCRDKLAEWGEAGAGSALVNLPTGAPFEMTEQMLRAIAPR